METVLGELRDEVGLVLVSPGPQRGEHDVGSLPEESSHHWPTELGPSHQTVHHPPPVLGQTLQVGREVGGALGGRQKQNKKKRTIQGGQFFF